MNRVVLLMVVFTISIGDAMCQNDYKLYPFDTTQTYRIELIDGLVFIGKYLHRDHKSVTIETASLPEVSIPFNKIKSVTPVKENEIKQDGYWFYNRHATRYLLTNSAFSLKAGEGYYQNTYVLLNSVNVGITNNLSISGGFEILSTFIALEPIFYVKPQIAFEVDESLHAGVSYLYASLPDFDTERGRESLGVLYGMGTFGPRDLNMTIGVGWGSVSGEFSPEPFLTFSGTARFARGAAFVTENWIVPVDGYYGTYSYGIRFFGEKIAVDLAFWNNRDISEGLLIGIPFVDFVVAF